MYECVKRMRNDLFARTEREMRDELPEGSDTAMASRRTRALRESTADAGLEWDGHTAILNDLAVAFDGKYFAQMRRYYDEISAMALRAARPPPEGVDHRPGMSLAIDPLVVAGGPSAWLYQFSERQAPAAATSARIASRTTGRRSSALPDCDGERPCVHSCGKSPPLERLIGQDGLRVVEQLSIERKCFGHTVGSHSPVH